MMYSSRCVEVPARMADVRQRTAHTHAEMQTSLRRNFTALIHGYAQAEQTGIFDMTYLRHSITALPLVLMLPFVLTGYAMAADVDIRSSIDAVTVYPDAASVQRKGDVDLPQGASTVIFRGLPATIDPNSLRVEAAGAARVVIGSVELRTSGVTNRTGDNAAEAKLRVLRAEREAWQTTLDALEGKKAMIQRFAQTGPEKLSPDGKPLDIAQWTAAWDTVGQAMAKIGDELRAARSKAREIDEDIQALEQARQRPTAQTLRDVVVQVESEAATKLAVALTYRVGQASWQPVYDARLDTGDMSGKPALELVRRAAISQRTGEDWSGVALSVSTVRAKRGTSAPDLQTQRLAFWEPRPYAAAPAASAPAPGPLGVARSKSADESVEVARPAPVPAREQEAQLDAGAFQASFRIGGRIDVPTDGSVKTLRISTATVSPQLVVKATPALDETAYLQVKLTNDDEAPILPGAVTMTRDGIFVGTGRIGLVAPGDSLSLGFGADDSVKVTRSPIRRKENEPTWFGQTKSEQREFRTTVKNLHKFKVSVSLIDQIPISENTAITVEQLPAPATTPPTDKIVDDKRGVMGWTLDVGAGETKEIKLGYRLKWPADREVIWQTIAK